MPPGSDCDGCRSHLTGGVLWGYGSNHCPGSRICIQLSDLGCGGIFLTPALFWAGVVTAAFVASASLSLPLRALGATGKHALATTLLSSLCFCVFAFTFFLATPVALAALIATPAVGSLGAIWEGNTSRPLRTTIIAVLAIYCASLLALWSVSGDVRLSVLASMVVAGSAWLVLPAIVAVLRQG